MSLQDRLLEPINGLGLSMEDEFDAVNAIHEIVDDVAQQFVDWYNVHSSHYWAREMSTAEIYEQFKLTL
jgi:hypothetical protein